MSKRTRKNRKQRRIADLMPAPAANLTAATYKYCSHDGTQCVMEVHQGKTRIYPFQESRMLSLVAPSLIIDCSDEFKTYQTLVLPQGYESFSKHMPKLPLFQIPWKDGTAPELPLEFWSELSRSLPEGNVYIGCLGAHGRTGTALACLRLQYTPDIGPAACIAEVRSTHCDQAIETQAQIDYIYQIAAELGLVDPPETVRPTVNKLLSKYSNYDYGYGVGKVDNNGLVVRTGMYNGKLYYMGEHIDEAAPGGPTLERDQGVNDPSMYPELSAERILGKSWDDAAGNAEIVFNPDTGQIIERSK